MKKVKILQSIHISIVFKDESGIKYVETHTVNYDGILGYTKGHPLILDMWQQGSGNKKNRLVYRAFSVASSFRKLDK
jgi:hypothetical protein